MPFRTSPLLVAGLVLITAHGGAAQTWPFGSSVGWPTHGGNPQHTANSAVRAQKLNRIVWSTPLDLDPQYNGDTLYAHYGSPVVSPKNVIVMPVRIDGTHGFRIEARKGDTGKLLWTQSTDFVLPSYNTWTPTMGPTLIGETVAYPRKAGLVGFRDAEGARHWGPDTACFFGMANYKQNPAAYDAAVKISSPIVTDEDGTLYFTYRVEGATPMNLKDGLAMVRRNGTSSWVTGAKATGTTDFVRPKMNAAPAIFRGNVYVVFRKEPGSDGMLVAVDKTTLQPHYKTALLDPGTNSPALVDEQGTACPTIGPDGDVFYGVLENPFGSHHYRGWLLHFNRTLTIAKTPGSFGWDDAPSIVPSSMVAGYQGTSSYLVMTKYNNYVGAGDGVNKIAVLDPNAIQDDSLKMGTSVMKEVLTKVGPTPDAAHAASYPNAVREWCINSAAVDVRGHSIMVNCEDGILYHWNLDTNELDQKMVLNSGIGEAYTPTLIGTNGMVYAISNARLYAVGK